MVDLFNHEYHQGKRKYRNHSQHQNRTLNLSLPWMMMHTLKTFSTTGQWIIQVFLQMYHTSRKGRKMS